MFAYQSFPLALFVLTAAILPVGIYRVLTIIVGQMRPDSRDDAHRTQIGSISLLATILVLLGALQYSGAAIPNLTGLAFLVLLAVTLAFIEEIRRLPTQFAFSFRVLIGATAYFLGFGFSLTKGMEAFPVNLVATLEFVLTVGFYVSVLYTMALLDSLRGLASGIVVIVALTLLSLMLLWRTSGDIMLLPLVIAGICVGHLLLLGNDKHLQLGSVGQVLVGVLLAASTLTSRTWGPTITMLVVPLIACSVPLAERLFSAVTRLRLGGSVHAPAQLHRLLISMGFKDRWVVLLLWVMTLHIAVLVHLVYASGRVALGVAVVASIVLIIALPLLFLLKLADNLDAPDKEGRQRILFFSHYFYPEVNAPASRLYEHAKRWAREGHHVTVVCPIPSAPHGWCYEGYRNCLWAEENIDGIRVIRIWTFLAANKGKIRRTLNYLSYMTSSLAALVFLRRHDVIVATSPQFFCGLIGAFATLFRRERFVLEVRDIWPESIAAVGAGRKKILLDMVGALAKWMYSRADQIVTVGEGYRDKLLESGAAPYRRISVIPNGIDFERFGECQPEEGKATFERLGIEGKFVVSYVGTIGMAHGLKVAIEAGEKLRGVRDDIVFLIVGDGAERKNLEAEVRAKHLDNVIFTGLLPKEEVPGIINRSSASLVHLRKTELFKTVLPSKLFEGMAISKPIILGVRGYAEGILNRANAGIAIEPESADELCEAVMQLAADPEYCAELGRNGREFVEREYNRDQLARDYTDVLRMVVERSEGSDQETIT